VLNDLGYRAGYNYYRDAHQKEGLIKTTGKSQANLEEKKSASTQEGLYST